MTVKCLIMLAPACCSCKRILVVIPGGLQSCDPFHKHFTLVIYGPSKKSWTIIYYMHAQMKCFQNALAYIETAVSYRHKTFMKLTPCSWEWPWRLGRAWQGSEAGGQAEDVRGQPGVSHDWGLGRMELSLSLQQHYWYSVRVFATVSHFHLSLIFRARLDTSWMRLNFKRMLPDLYKNIRPEWKWLTLTNTRANYD